MSFQWLSPCQERRGVFLLPLGGCYCCNLMYQTFRDFLMGTAWDYSSTLWWWWLLFGGTLSCSEHHWPSQHPREMSLQVFSQLSWGQYWEVLWLVHDHVTRKWQRLDCNTGRFPNEAHEVPFLFLIKFFKIVENAHNVKFTILTIFKHAVQYC